MDIYQINSVMHGDCVAFMRRMESESIDFILTDPPYITRYRSRDGRTVINDDNGRWLQPAFTQMYRLLKNGSFCVSFCGWNKGRPVHLRMARRRVPHRWTHHIPQKILVVGSLPALPTRTGLSSGQR